MVYAAQGIHRHTLAARARAQPQWPRPSLPGHGPGQRLSWTGYKAVSMRVEHGKCLAKFNGNWAVAAAVVVAALGICNIMINHWGFCLRSRLDWPRCAQIACCPTLPVCQCALYVWVCVCVPAYLKHFISADTPQSKCASVCVCVCVGKIKAGAAFLIARDNAKSVAYFRTWTTSAAKWRNMLSLSFAIDFHVISFGC